MRRTAGSAQKFLMVVAQYNVGESEGRNWVRLWVSCRSGEVLFAMRHMSLSGSSSLLGR
jgi:hypothetical protein